MKQELIRLIGNAFSNQRELQHKLRPDWADQHTWHYYRAVWTEIAEAIGHTNWYWWKTGQFGKDMTATQLVEMHIELCDILHFGLTLDIYKGIHGGRSELDRIQDYYSAFEDAASSTEPADVALEGIVVDAILLREFNVKKFARACRAVGMDLTMLLTYYFAKSSLNMFRWDHGYNEKTYVKMWKLPGRPGAIEDNTFLGEIVAGLFRKTEQRQLVAALGNGELHSALYKRLADAYAILEK